MGKKKYVIYKDVNAMPKSEEIFESEPQIQYENEKESKRHRIGFYRDLVKEFLASNKPIWTYPVPQDMLGGSYLLPQWTDAFQKKKIVRT